MSMTQRLPFLPRALMALMSGVLVLLLGATHAWAQSSEPVSTGALQSTTIDPDEEVQPGTEITLSGSGFAPGAQIDIVIESDPIHLGTVNADATGYFEATVTIPTTGLPAGDHTLKATGPDPTGGLRVLSISVEVAGSPGAAAPRPGGSAYGLPVTGSAVLPLAAFGLAAIVGGAFLVQRTRRTA